MRCFFVFSVLLLACAARASEPVLVFKVSTRTVAEMTASQMQRRVGSYRLSLKDADYGKTKSYECLPMKALAASVFGSSLEDGVHTEAVFQAFDGYASVTRTARLEEEGGCLAFRDLDYPEWEPVGRKRVDPGPFYLVWGKPGQSAEKGYPWPYQLATISLVKFDERYPEVVPAGAQPGSPAMKGFELFQARCFRCHSINQEGGKIGPDLNAPQSVTSYRTKKWIKSYVRQPSRYRYTEMPDHLDLSDEDLEDLYQYFRWKARQPEKAAF